MRNDLSLPDFTAALEEISTLDGCVGITSNQSLSAIKRDAKEKLVRWEHSRFTGDNKLACNQCAVPYREVTDLVVPDKVWTLITPAKHPPFDKGVLCPTCICQRMETIGLAINLL